jgi:chromosomal replication initiation ATPase DnaA
MNIATHRISHYAAPGVMPPIKPTLGSIEQQVCRYYNLANNAVYVRSRRFELIKARRAVFLIGRYYGYTLTHMGRRAGLSHASVYHNLVRLLNEIEVMPAVRHDFDALCLQLGIEAQQIIQHKRHHITSP